MDLAFADSVRELLSALASGGEPTLPAGGGLSRVLRETGALTLRTAVDVLVDRWFRAPAPNVRLDSNELLLNRPELGESEKLRATLHEHVVGQCRWQELSSNESTFYRYRRAAITAFAERLWAEIVDRPLPSNRPLPEYVRFIGRQQEVGMLLRWLGEPGGTVVGIEGPGGSGKTALLHAVADACEAIRLEPGKADAYLLRGSSFHHLGDLEQALQDYTEAIRLQPNNAPAHVNRGVAFHTQ